MTVRLVVRETFCKGQSPVFIQVQIGQLSTDRFPVGSLVCQPQFGSQLGSGIESKVHQGKVIVCHILEPRIDRVVENFRAGTQRQPAYSVSIDCGDLFEISRHVLQKRVGPLFQENAVGRILPMQIEMLSQPCADRRRHGVLYPSAHRLAGQGANAGNIHPVRPEILSGIFFIHITLFPKGIQIAHPLLQMVAGIGRPITQLCVQVMMVVSFPGRQHPVIGCPDCLKGNRIRVLAGSRPELVHLVVVLFLQERIRQRDGRLCPIAFPEVHMRAVVCLHATLHRLCCFLVCPVGSQRRSQAPYAAERAAFLLPTDDHIVRKASPPFLMESGRTGFLLYRPLFISEASQGRTGMRVVACDLVRIAVAGCNDLRRNRIRQVLEDKPSDRFVGMHERFQLRPVLPKHLTKGIIEEKMYGRNLPDIQRELQSRPRYLRRGRQGVIRVVELLLHRQIIPFPHLLTDPGKTIVRSCNTIHRAQVPEIRPIQRKT